MKDLFIFEVDENARYDDVMHHIRLALEPWIDYTVDFHLVNKQMHVSILANLSFLNFPERQTKIQQVQSQLREVFAFK